MEKKAIVIRNNPGWVRSGSPAGDSAAVALNDARFGVAWPAIHAEVPGRAAAAHPAGAFEKI